MCGIFAYMGEGREAAEAVCEGLKKLDYRGYDSWGVATLEKGDITVERHVGIVGRLEKTRGGTMAIGHTRWATHGSVTEANAHPHRASDGSFALAHNGIVENADVLREQLEKKQYSFFSETDTEVIVRLIEDKWKRAKTLEDAMRAAFKELSGRNTIILITTDGRIIGARNGSPMVVGVHGAETYVSSDVLSFGAHVSDVLVVDNGQMVVVTPQGISLMSIASGKPAKTVFEKNTLERSDADKGEYAHFMIKEIMESPAVIDAVLRSDMRALKQFAGVIKKARHVYTIGSGTAAAAAAQMAYYLRTHGSIQATELIGAEATEYYSLFKRGDLVIALSQSGETADVLEVLEIAKKKGVTIASYVNMPGSMMTRMSKYAFMAGAGPEICVMSTKIFTSQIAWGYLVSKAVEGKLADGTKNLAALKRIMSAYLSSEESLASLRALAPHLAQKQHLFILAKAQNLQIAREAMVKIIEGSYIHAHAIPAGDLKHYAITLMEEGTPVLAILSKDSVRTDIGNALHEVKSRGAHLTCIYAGAKPESENAIEVPDTKETSAIMNIIPIQLLAYFMAVYLGNNVDKPRNIAKSVTVK